MKDRKRPGCKIAPGSAWKGVPRADPSVPPVLAWEPLILVAFPCCITSLPLLHPSPVFFPRYSEVTEGGKSAGECREEGDADGTALGNCSLPSFFRSRSSLPWGLNSIRHKRGQISSRAAVSH